MFNLNELLNANKKEEIAPFEIKMINIFDIEPSKDNFYDTKDILDLKDSIEMFGVQQNITVKKVGDKYKLIAGHRRRLACVALVEEGKEEFINIPAKIENEISDIVEKILLIQTNSTARELNDWEKAEQLKQLKELLSEYKKINKLPGRVRDFLAETLKISPTQVGRYEKVNKNLAPALKEEMKKGNIKITQASKLAELPQEEQEKAFRAEPKKEVVKSEFSIETINFALDFINDEILAIKSDIEKGNEYTDYLQENIRYLNKIITYIRADKEKLR